MPPVKKPAVKKPAAKKKPAPAPVLKSGKFQKLEVPNG